VSIIHLLWSLVIGFVVGLIARAILPGAQAMGFWMTAILGIVGSFVGGFIGSLISKPPEGAKFHPAGLLMSIVGAIVVLWLWGMLAH
jgi:uncharacterized membrane protein YeaQ/YmgE (transglycosylase-associated protein family)